MEIKLSQGALELICSGETNLASDPMLQVSDIRLLNNDNTTERYRLLLSDGVQLQQGMLATQRNKFVQSRMLQKGSVIRLSQYSCYFIQNRSIIIVIDLEVIMVTYDIIGNPKFAGGARPTAQVPSSAGQTGMMPVNAQHGNLHLSGSGPTFRPSGNLPQTKLEHGAHMQSFGWPSASNQDSGPYTINSGPAGYPKQEFGMGNSGNATVGVSCGGFHNSRIDFSRAPVNPYPCPQQPLYQQQHPVYVNRGPIAKNEAAPRIILNAASNPYRGPLTVKARVTTKSELTHYNNQRGEGKVFSFDLLDSDGGDLIQVTCFNAVADKFYNQIKVGSGIDIQRNPETSSEDF